MEEQPQTPGQEGWVGKQSHWRDLGVTEPPQRGWRCQRAAGGTREWLKGPWCDRTTRTRERLEEMESVRRDQRASEVTTVWQRQ